MTVTAHNIPGVETPPMSSHATVARGDVIVHISGQVGTDETGAVVEGLSAQTERAILNVATALEAAGASVTDVAKSTFYVVDWDPSMMEELTRGAAAASAKIPIPNTAITLIGVKSLFTPDMLIEIEVVAVLDP